ncbi:hypothetical protein Ddc_15208 [Ditylenchus destructor]|nr:hypothetical protein Ddc_15208 [Ditylenchus destructor]
MMGEYPLQECLDYVPLSVPGENVKREIEDIPSDSVPLPVSGINVKIEVDEVEDFAVEDMIAFGSNRVDPRTDHEFSGAEDFEIYLDMKQEERDAEMEKLMHENPNEYLRRMPDPEDM